MNKMTMAAILTAGLSLGSLAADAATTNVNVVNTGANPVPVVGTVEVLATPPVRAGSFRQSCQLATGATSCSTPSSITAPAGSVFRVTSISGQGTAQCQNNVSVYAYVTGTLEVTSTGGMAPISAYVSGVTYASSPRSTTVLNSTGQELYLSKIDKITFFMTAPAASCPYPAYGDLTFTYVIELLL